jgi:hypothetical protein
LKKQEGEKRACRRRIAMPAADLHPSQCRTVEHRFVVTKGAEQHEANARSHSEIEASPKDEIRRPGGVEASTVIGPTSLTSAFRTGHKIPLFPARGTGAKSPLCHSWVGRHRSEIMFGVLVVVLRSDPVARSEFTLGQRQISLIVSLCVVSGVTLRLWARGTRYPRLRVAPKRGSSSRLMRTHVVFRPFGMAHSLDNARWLRFRSAHRAVSGPQ